MMATATLNALALASEAAEEKHSTMIPTINTTKNVEERSHLAIRLQKTKELLTLSTEKTDKIVEKENEKLSKFLGKSATKLQMELGKPDEDFTNAKGNFELVYNSKKYLVPCERRFEINSEKIVIGFVSNGCF